MIWPFKVTMKYNCYSNELNSELTRMKTWQVSEAAAVLELTNKVGRRPLPACLEDIDCIVEDRG